MSVVDTTFTYIYANNFPIISAIFYLIIFILLILNSGRSHPSLISCIKQFINYNDVIIDPYTEAKGGI
jgi:hypothetical protein